MVLAARTTTATVQRPRYEAPAPLDKVTESAVIDNLLGGGTVFVTNVVRYEHCKLVGG